MSVRVAASAGFCFGVDRAVGLVEQTVREGKRAVMSPKSTGEAKKRVSSRYLCTSARYGEMSAVRRLRSAQSLTRAMSCSGCSASAA